MSPSVVCIVARVASFVILGALLEILAIVASSLVGFSLNTSRSALLSLFW